MSNPGKRFQFQLAFGWAAPKISQQLIEYGIEDVPPKKVDAWQKTADAILQCFFGGALTHSQANNARNRLTRHIEKWLLENEHVEVSA